MADRESSTSLREFPLGLNRGGLRGVIFAVDDDHPRPERSLSKAALAYGLPTAADAFSTNALDYLLRKGADHCTVVAARLLSLTSIGLSFHSEALP